jgi:hypothetical protein
LSAYIVMKGTDIFHLLLVRSGLDAQYKIWSSTQILVRKETEQADGNNKIIKFLKQLLKKHLQMQSSFEINT